MKYSHTTKDSKVFYLKYKSEFGEYYDSLIDFCTEWEKFCQKNMFNPSKRKQILENDILKNIKEINEKVDAVHNGGIKSFLVEMINGQHTELLIPYLVIEKSLPEDYANIHVGLLGSGEQIFYAITEN